MYIEVICPEILMEIKALIFDLDGTIADTKASVCEAVNMAMDHFNMPYVTSKQVGKAMGNGAIMLIKRLLPPENSGDEDFVCSVFEYYDNAYDVTCINAPFYDGMKEIMLDLKSKGYKIAVLSNKQDRYVKKIIEHSFGAGTLDFVQGQTSLPIKPDPAVPLMIAEELGVAPEECAFIGDSEVDVITAKNAKMTGVACAWGYRPKALLEENTPDFLIDSPRELLNIFK